MKNNKNFRLLAGKVLLFTFPVLLLAIMSVVVDPFKVYRQYDDYDRDTFVPLNRELLCLKLYQRNKSSLCYNSFIFGNSRSQAFKVNNWKAFLPADSKAFHFDGAGGGIYGIHNRIRYIDQSGGRLDHALVIVDQLSLSLTKNAKGHSYISPPELSKESPLAFYSEFTKPLLNIRFVIGYIDYSIFATHREYMRKLIYNPKYPNSSDPRTADVYYGIDRRIFEDSDGYYKEQIDKGTFYDRGKRVVMSKPVTQEEKELLVNMRKYFDKHHTDYRIVVCPLYDQKPLGDDHVQLLQSVFGAERVYDYSGINRFTQSLYNYYEESHFRPTVADEIMKEIYR